MPFQYKTNLPTKQFRTIQILFLGPHCLPKKFAFKTASITIFLTIFKIEIGRVPGAAPWARSRLGSWPGSRFSFSVRNYFDPASLQVIVVILLDGSLHVPLARELDNAAKNTKTFKTTRSDQKYWIPNMFAIPMAGVCSLFKWFTKWPPVFHWSGPLEN